MSDAMSDSCHGDGFRVVPVVGNVVAGAGHGDQTEQNKHSSDLHFDLRRTKAAWMVNSRAKLQALVYDILPSTTAVFCYATGSRKLSANEQFFVGAQTVVRLLQTTQIIVDVYFITDHIAYASSNKTKIEFESKRPLFILPGVDASHVYVRAIALGCIHSHISTETFWRALTASVDSCAEIKSASSVA